MSVLICLSWFKFTLICSWLHGAKANVVSIYYEVFSTKWYKFLKKLSWELISLDDCVTLGKMMNFDTDIVLYESVEYH